MLLVLDSNKMYLELLFFVFCASQFPYGFAYDNGQLVEGESVLDPNGTFALSWRVDYSTRRVQFQMQAANNGSLFKWFALGFSDRGELYKSDICLYWTDNNGYYNYEDMHNDGYGKLIRDGRQDCDMFYFDPQTRTLSFERLFDTCDDNDYLIEEGTVHIVWAHGNEDLPSSGDLCLTCQPRDNRGFTRVMLLTPVPTPPVTGGVQLRITLKNMVPPARQVFHWCRVVKLPDFLIEKEHHIVQFESTITPENTDIIPIVVLLMCSSANGEDIPLYEGDYDAKPEAIKGCTKVMALATIQGGSFTFPDEAGFPIGGPTGDRYLLLRVHYFNPGLRTDWVDSSGIVLHITEEKRKHDAAIFKTGIKLSGDMAIPGEQTDFPVTSYCAPECTEMGIPPEGITVFGSQLHAHWAAVAMWIRHSRQGVELPMLIKDMHYAAAFEPSRLLRRPVKVFPGDALETTCVYNTMDKPNATIIGVLPQDEMCLNYLYYYPATNLRICQSAVGKTALLNYFNFERRWNNVSISLESPPRQNYLAITPWTRNRVEMLHTIYTEFPISVKCDIDGAPQGNWEEKPIPKIKIPTPGDPKICPPSYNAYV